MFNIKGNRYRLVVRERVQTRPSQTIIHFAL
ncbi:MAG: hypothetical protein WD824_12625 [Cyclobacteriaceae bacterium]